MEIRPLKMHEVILCVPFGQKFHTELKLAGTFIPDVFVNNWLSFLSSYPSVILSLWHEEQLVGGLGGMITPDLNDLRPCAQEFFWFVDPAHRVGTGAIRLLKAFEAWATEKQAVEIRMVHMISPQDAQLERVYHKLGYTRVEICYRKSLVKES